MVKYSGWSSKGKPFTQCQFKQSALGKTLSYSSYIEEYARQYKNPKLRKTL